MYKEVFSRYRILAVVTIVLILGVFLTRLPQAQAQAHFVITGFDYDDGYGQGIEVLWLYENSSGSWEPVKDPAFFFFDDETTYALNWTENTALRVGVTANINHTLFDFGPDKNENDSARAIMRVGLTVSCAKEILFSLDIMTWDETCYDDTATTWSISYADTLDTFLIQMGTIYVARFVYEIYR